MEKGLNNQSLNMSQLKTLLGMLDFDNDKVKIATLGYQKCTDKDNYKMLQDSFSFDNSMRNFTQAIGR
jgi:acetoacetate decarboxylase